MQYVSNCESYAIIVAIRQEITFHYLSPANSVDSLCCCEPFSPSWPFQAKFSWNLTFFLSSSWWPIIQSNSLQLGVKCGRQWNYLARVKLSSETAVPHFLASMGIGYFCPTCLPQHLFSPVVKWSGNGEWRRSCPREKCVFGSPTGAASCCRCTSQGHRSTGLVWIRG